MCVCVCSFLPPRASRPRNIGTYIRVHCDMEKTFIVESVHSISRDEQGSP